jgi:succinate-semialdehyde dehydrogenase / glutarate-semialdehyde dehydrogenase
MGRRSYIQNRSLGVVGIITHWNYPLGIPFSQTVMALAAGNAVIFKPSPESPLTALAMARLFEGLVPQDLLQAVVGGDDHGRAVVTLGVDRLIFTGSPPQGSPPRPWRQPGLPL